MTDASKWLTAFGTYDIRALVNDVLTEEAYYAYGRSFAIWLRSQVPPSLSQLWVAVGYDARLHSPPLSASLVKGLLEGGISVLDLGLVPTPLVYFSEHFTRQNTSLATLQATLTVTASHNPAPYNGLKFTFDGKSFDREQLAEFKQACTTFLEQQNPPSSASTGTYRQYDIRSDYLTSIRSISLPAQAPTKVVVDCGNGTAGVVAREAIEQLGYETVMLFEEPDGRFPNHHPDPCVHANMSVLSKAVKAHGADLGVAFDGDSDRLGVVDENGTLIPGDLVLLLYAEALLKQPRESNHTPTVVSEVKCSQVLFDSIEAMGGRAIMSPTGHAFLKKRMLTENAEIGGELSGHFFFRDKHPGFDDAIYAAIRLLEIVASAKAEQQNTRMSDLLARFPGSILSEEQRIFCPRDKAPTVLTLLNQRLQATPDLFGEPISHTIDIDGCRFILPGGFVLVRASNTEPCLTVRIEAPDETSFKTRETRFQTVIEQVLEEARVPLKALQH